MVNIPIFQGLQSMDWIGILYQGVIFLGIFLLGVFLSAIFGAIVYVMPYKFKAIEMTIEGTGGDQIRIGRIRRWQRYRWNKAKDAWRPLLPLLNRVEIMPFDAAHIYSNRNVFAYKVGESTFQGKMSLKGIFGKKDASKKLTKAQYGGLAPDKGLQEIEGSIKLVPHEVRKWQSIQHKRHEIEFAKKDFWSDNKPLFMMLGTVFLCLILVGLTVFLTFRYVGGAAGSMDRLSAALQNIGTNVIS